MSITEFISVDAEKVIEEKWTDKDIKFDQIEAGRVNSRGYRSYHWILMSQYH
jgi:ppGpp synthetase/RelA/SpoT-type nucleotidyltranferase